MRRDMECPVNGVTNYDRVWGKGARKRNTWMFHCHLQGEVKMTGKRYTYDSLHDCISISKIST